MKTTTARSAAEGAPDTVALARSKVRDLLTKSPAFRALPHETQREIARNTVEVATYLAEPDGVRLTPDAYAQPLADQAGATTGDPPEFRAGAAREGAAVAGALLDAVNFPQFVSSLIDGVFHSIVQSSIEQMEAYGRLVADVAKSLNQFRDENVSVNQGRDHLVDQHPDLFEISVDTGAFGFGDDDGGGPRVRLRDGVDESAALARLRDLPVEGGPITSLDDDVIEEKLVPAARTQLATSRQQLLATMVMMGINRIVVTDGKISAKVMYDFKAQDNLKFQHSATKFDYGDKYITSSEGEREVDIERGSYRRSRGADGADDEDRRGGSYYSKGTYKTSSRPVVTLASATQTAGDATLATRAQLAGVVDINFRSDFFPLERMADSFQIAQIQDAAQPGAQPAPAAGAGRGSPTSTPGASTPGGAP